MKKGKIIKLPKKYIHRVYLAGSLDELGYGNSILWYEGRILVETSSDDGRIFGNAEFILGETKKRKGLLQILSNGRKGKPCFRERIEYVISTHDTKDTGYEDGDRSFQITPDLNEIYLSLGMHALSTSYQNGRRIDLTDCMLNRVFNNPIKRNLKQEFFN